MWDHRPAGTPAENDFAIFFLALGEDELRQLFGICHDQVFREQHKKLIEYLERALLYRERQIQSNLEDACSMQDPYWDQWEPAEIVNAVHGLDRLRVISEENPKLLDFVLAFGRVLTIRGFERWLSAEERLRLPS